MHKSNFFIPLLAISILPFFGFAQDKKDTPPANWYNLDYATDGVMDISTERAYSLLAGRKSTPVVVAVIDGGVDVEHEDLKDVVWINKKDDNSNGKDDDGNGYTDDKYGWNFIGNANGENVNHDNLEVTRLSAKYEPKYISVLPSTPLSEAERREFVAYQKMVSDYTTKMDVSQFGDLNYGRLKQEVQDMVAIIGKEPKAITKDDLDKFSAENDRQKLALKVAKKEMDDNKSFEKFYEELKEAVEYYHNQVNYHLNKQYDPRPIVGDNYEDATERYYG